MCRDLGLDLPHVRKRPIPARLQFARNQSVGWIGRIVLPEGAIGGIARRLEIVAEGLAHLIPPLARLLLGSCGGCDRAGTDHSQQRILDGVINTQSAEGDAVRRTIVRELCGRLGDEVDQAAWRAGISMTSMPFWNLIPWTTFGNWFSPFNRRHVFAAALTSLNTMSLAVFADRAPFVRTVR